MKNSFAGEKLLFKIIPLFFFSVLVFKILYVYITFEAKEREFVKNNSIVINNIINKYSNHLKENGDILAILNIKRQNSITKEYFINWIVFDLIYDFVILIILFLLIQYILKNIKDYKLDLQDNINNKTFIIRKKESKIDAFYDNLIIYHMDINGVIIFVNENLSKISEYSKEELIGKNHIILFDKNIDSCIFGDMWESILWGHKWSKELKCRTKNNKCYYTKTTVIPLIDKKSGFINEFMIIQDNVTSFIKQKERIKSILLTDNLTKLSNRDKLIKDISNAKNPKVALINIDKFKEINDFYGYKFGDSLLIEIANILNEIVNSSNITLYKLSSDEFAILQDCSNSFEIFIEFISIIIKQLESHLFEIENQQLTINVSAGISKSKLDTLSTADMALHKAKLEKKSISVYDNTMNIEEEIKKNIIGVSIVKNAIKNDKIVPYFQPILNIKLNTIDKYETLARLIDNDKISPPNSFIYYAKRAKLYPFITKIIVAKSFKKFKSLNDKKIGFSINISLQDVKNQEVVNIIKSELSKCDNPNRVVFEILESEELENYEQISQFIKDIKSFGAKIAIDDFGSGYSNFLHLLRLNIDYLKIDSSLIKNINNDKKAKILIESIVYFTKKLNIKTVAEYVEDEKTLDELRNLGIDFAQGYLIGKPKENIL